MKRNISNFTDKYACSEGRITHGARYVQQCNTYVSSADAAPLNRKNGVASFGEATNTGRTNGNAPTSTSVSADTEGGKAR